jgi:hypothetical protein
MNFYYTIYRYIDSIDEQMEINVCGYYDKATGFVDIEESVDTFDDSAVELTKEEREEACIVGLDEWLEKEGE